MGTVADFFKRFFASTGEVEKTNYAFKYAISLGVFGILFLFFYSVAFGSIMDGASNRMLSTLMFIALASFASGGVIGFLFGIPRKLQHANGNGDSSDAEFSHNTNLEQISDWLTKILVGVGLTQIPQIQSNFDSLITSLGRSINPKSMDQSTVFAGAIVTFFAIDGFIMTYLWTRLFLAKIEGGDIASQIDTKLQDTDKNNKLATSLANQQMNLPLGVEDVPVDDLVKVFKKASGNVLNYVFFRAVSVRKASWNNDKNKVERTIPIFRALIKLDSTIEFPENYAELGYALKDKSNPEYTEALENLNRALEGFVKKGNTSGIGILYYNIAYCKISLDPQFENKERSTPENAKAINYDIAEASKEDYVREIVQKDELIQDWKKLNPLS